MKGDMGIPLIKVVGTLRATNASHTLQHATTLLEFTL